MIDEIARKRIQAEMQNTIVSKAEDESPVMQIIHHDGNITEVNNPFAAMLATYAALAADPNAMPELNDESRATILNEIKTGQVAVPIAPAPQIETTTPHPNRHQRRRETALRKRKNTR